jgi:hypothetical protein
MKARSLLRAAVLTLCMITAVSAGGSAAAYRGPGSGSDVPSGAVKIISSIQRGFTRLQMRVNPGDWKKPWIETSAVDGDTGSRTGVVGKKARIVDRVSYGSLMTGNGYVVEGVLMDSETGKPLLIDGREIRSSVPFSVTDDTGSVEVEFELDTSALRGKSVVVFEKIYDGEYLMLSHSDLNDDEQTVRYPDIGTSASSASTGTRTGDPSKAEKITDTVSYSSLTPGKEYTIRGKLMDRDSGEPVRDKEGREITSEKKFTPSTSSGTETLEFTYDSSLRHGRTTVVFEDLCQGDIRLVSHADIGDAGQSITYPEKPAIGTTLTDGSGGRKVKPGVVAKLTDEVRYENLTPGKKYTLRGRLVLKSTGETLQTGGKPVTAETEFVPESAGGTASVVFEADLGEAAGESLVAFEQLIGPDGDVIASHEDINDGGQTVEVEKKPEEKPPEETPPEEQPPEELKTEPEAEKEEEVREAEETSTVAREKKKEEKKEEKPEIRNAPKTGDLETAKAVVFICITALSGALLALLTRLRRYDRL